MRHAQRSTLVGHAPFKTRHLGWQPNECKPLQASLVQHHEGIPLRKLSQKQHRKLVALILCPEPISCMLRALQFPPCHACSVPIDFLHGCCCSRVDSLQTSEHPPLEPGVHTNRNDGHEEGHCGCLYACMHTLVLAGLVSQASKQASNTMHSAQSGLDNPNSMIRSR
jgi:hypothetical protein